MTTFELYSSWNRLLGQWLTDRCRTRRANLIWLIIGLHLGRGVQASSIVKQWLSAAKTVSLTRRLSRFLDNPAVRPAVWYRPVARQVLARWAGRTVTLAIDATAVGIGHQLVMVAVSYKHRALPLAWSWVSHYRGQTTVEVQRAVLQRVRGLLPAEVQVILTGDAGFASVALLRQVSTWGWQYVVRQNERCLIQCAGQTEWQPLGGLLTGPGQQVWLPQVNFTHYQSLATGVLAYWPAGESQPWLLTTNLADARSARQAYARRMGIEEMFGDWKGHGWDLGSTHLRHVDRLSRLLLAVCLLYIWLMLYGERVIKAGWRQWVDRHDRRDLSLMRIGLDILQRCAALHLPLPVPLPSLVGGPSVR